MYIHNGSKVFLRIFISMQESLSYFYLFYLIFLMFSTINRIDFKISKAVVLNLVNVTVIFFGF